MAAIFDFNGSVRLGRERNLYQGAVDGQKEGVGWGGGVKITPAQSHRYFAKLRSPTNGVPDWCS